MFPCSFSPKQTTAEQSMLLRALPQQAERVAFVPFQIWEQFPALSAKLAHPKACYKRKNVLYWMKCSHEARLQLCLQLRRRMPEYILHTRR